MSAPKRQTPRAIRAGVDPDGFLSRRWSVMTGAGVIAARTLTPAAPSARPPLVALHGISRDAGSMFDAFSGAAQRAGRALVVPLFSAADWPAFQRIGAARPDLALLALIRLLGDIGVLTAPRFELFGYSGGAQLAHRFAMLYPRRVAHLHLAAAGWYCWPDTEVPFPFGAGDSRKPHKPGHATLPRLMRDQFSDYLAVPKTIFVGTGDTLRDEALRTDHGIDALQGPTRLDRARRYARALDAAAAARGIATRAGFVELPGCGHSFTQCARMTDMVARVAG